MDGTPEPPRHLPVWAPPAKPPNPPAALSSPSAAPAAPAADHQPIEGDGPAPMAATPATATSLAAAAAGPADALRCSAAPKGRRVLPSPRPVLEHTQLHVDAPQCIYLLAKQMQLGWREHLQGEVGGGSGLQGPAQAAEEWRQAGAGTCPCCLLRAETVEGMPPRLTTPSASCSSTAIKSSGCSTGAMLGPAAGLRPKWAACFV